VVLNDHVDQEPFHKINILNCFLLEEIQLVFHVQFVLFSNYIIDNSVTAAGFFYFRKWLRRHFWNWPSILYTHTAMSQADKMLAKSISRNDGPSKQQMKKNAIPFQTKLFRWTTRRIGRSEMRKIRENKILKKRELFTLFFCRKREKRKTTSINLYIFFHHPISPNHTASHV
jgi:hypothetical protein